MRILVTGGAGFVGSTLIPELLKEGHEVTVLDNLAWGLKGLSANFGRPGFNFVQGDVRDDELVGSLIEKNEGVVHLAALVGCALCESNKKEAADVNVNGSKRMDKYLSDDQLLIFASTGSVYGPANGSRCTEKTEPNPQSLYAVTKVEAEKIFSKRKNVVILRFATAFGVSLRMRLDLLVNQFVYEAVKHRALTVYGKNYLRSVIHVRDIARSIIFAINNRESMQGHTFNVSSEPTFTKEQIAQYIRKHVDYDLRFAESSSDSDGRNYQLSTERIEALGYSSHVTLDQGIAELIDSVTNSEVDETYFNAKAQFNG